MRLFVLVERFFIQRNFRGAKGDYVYSPFFASTAIISAASA